jgi:hypothetical protein
MDQLKRVKLSESGDVWMSVGGRADSRFESWDGFGFGAAVPGNSDTFTLTRLMLHADVHFGDVARLFVEGRSAQSTDRDLPGGRRITDVDTCDLFQAFADLVLFDDEETNVTFRVGRQSFVLGNQRLVAPPFWGNVWNAWDGATLLAQSGRWRSQLMYTEFVRVDPTRLNEADPERALYGAYVTRCAEQQGRGLDLYLLGDTRPNVVVNGTSGDERRHTAGFRSFGALGSGFDGELEGAWQFGRVGSSSVNAWFLSAVIGHRFEGVSWTPRLFGGLDAASGDDEPGGSVGTFFPLYPSGHAYFGFADVLSRQNVLAAHVGCHVRPSSSTDVSITAHVFRQMDRDDAMYAVNGSVARTGLGDGDVAQEIDLLVTHRVSRSTDLYFGYSKVFAGGALNGTGPTDDMDFAYAGVAVVF